MASAHAADAAKGSAGIDPSLYNADLAPIKQKGRTWRAYNIFTLWASDVHSLGNYTFAMGLFALGLGAWQIMAAILFGAALLFVLLNLAGFMGVRTGVPFPVMSRISFGIRGAQIPALIRGGVAIVWFGIQTYLAAGVGSVLVIAVFPGAATLTDYQLLGLDALGWLCFTVLWALQVLIAYYGMEVIRRYEAFAGPIILIAFVLLALWVLIDSGLHITFTPPDALTGAAMWAQIFGGGALWVAIYATFVLNFCDFTRSAVSKRAVVKGNLWGIPLNMAFFATIVIILTGGRLSIDGQVVTTAEDVVTHIPNTALLVLMCLGLLTLTVAVNLIANFVAPSYALTNLAPKKLNFRRAALLSGIIGFVILPWNLYNSPIVITYFLGGLGTVLGPVFGIVMADYWLVRRQRINVPELYTTKPDGDYYYRAGVNPRAIVAMVPAAAIALVFAFTPGLHAIGQFSWFIAAAIGAIVYYFVADRSRPFTDVNGEPIAVAVKH
ncbi:NCS1 family nucleobase:cation symporter-1 [Tamaricihabitans halophyticus]|uniref:NCS1 family nucleobase:cation symporter-1 n=1 Tax=Tamaricihabitans halophyticus TaxID=1262583 RepID=A0A4R2RAS3_9PSEU|nr:NCS1 family nucleobase:cation symporter-1 [Tamaricihabitans halophyticus]TCP56811.1 NCS1 family nucleobase:cation symporter-1 [Tamaricihabitans halophyticus]